MPLEALLSAGETCNRLHQLAGYIYQHTYSGLVAYYYYGRLRTGWYLETENYAEYIHKFSINSHEISNFTREQTKFRNIKQLSVRNVNVTSFEIESIKNVLKNVERFSISWWEVNGSFYDTVLAHCPKLTHLYLQSSPNGSTIIGSDNDWLLRKYPALEHFSLTMFWEPKIDELKTFLEINPNIKTFSAVDKWFWANREVVLSANVQLNELSIFITSEDWENFGSLWNLLNQLFERGFYKRLNLYYNVYACNQTLFDQMAKLNGIRKLENKCSDKISLSAFSDVENILFKDSDKLNDLDAIATNLTKLQKINFLFARMDHIKRLVSQAANLSKIIIGSLIDEENGRTTKWEPFLLREMNWYREKLAGAKKLTIYVEENVYLATKWKLKNTNLSLVQLLRTDSYEDDDDFNIFGHQQRNDI